MAIQIPYTDGFVPEPSVSNAESKDNKGVANGYAPLDANAKVPVANLPDTASLDAEVDAKITTHNSATTSVHGIANTANLVLTNDARLSDTRDPKTHTHTISDVTGLQTAIDNSGIKAGVQWTDRHTTSTGNQYAVGSIVYNAGRVFRCLATNDSITPAVGGNAYWADLGAGYLLPNENPKIQGGNIEISGGASIVLKSGTSGDADGGNGGAILQVGGNSANGLVQTGEDENGDPIYEDIDQVGGNAGYIWQNGATGGDYGAGGSAGYIDTSAYQGNSGGSIDTSNGGGSINTKGTGSIQLGVNGARTTLNGSASGSNKTITLPNATGTIALTSDSRFTDPRTPTSHTHGNITNDGIHTHGNITNDGKIPFSTTSVASITAVGSLDALVNGIYIITQGANVTANAVVGGTTGAKTIAMNGGVGTGYSNGSATIDGRVTLGTSGSANVNITIGNAYAYGQPLMTGNHGVVGLSSFGTTANTFCQGDDSRLSDNRTPKSHTHPASEISDSTTAGRALLTASTTQAQRTALDILVSASNLASFPASGNFQRLYLALDTQKTYVWNGTGYTEVSPNTHTRAGADNTNVGETALSSASLSGAGNVAVGTDSLKLNTSGAYNTSVGFGALKSNEIGASNTAVGSYVLYTNQSGIYNTGVGQGALFSNTASENCAIGLNAGFVITSGGKNVCVGSEADVDTGARASCVVLGCKAKSPAVDGSLAIGGTGGNAMGNLVTTSGGTSANQDLIIYLNGTRYRIALKT